MLAHCLLEPFFINFRFQPFFSDRDQAVAWEYDLSQRWVITLAVTRLTIITTTIVILVTTIITISPSAMSHRTRKEILELHVAPVRIHLPLSAPSSSSSSSSPSTLPHNDCLWFSYILPKSKFYSIALLPPPHHDGHQQHLTWIKWHTTCLYMRQPSLPAKGPTLRGKQCHCSESFHHLCH